jgi:hypothetical protein
MSSLCPRRGGARAAKMRMAVARGARGYSAGPRRGRPAGRGGPRGSVAPKYRNPENSAETWAGRGLRPRWLVAAIKGGKKLEDFAIGGPAEGSPAKKARANAGPEICSLWKNAEIRPTQISFRNFWTTCPENRARS